MSAEKPPEGRYAAMTVNERLHAAGLIDRFDAAARTRNREEMIALLALVELADQADWIADTILGDPSKYGY